MRPSINIKYETLKDVNKFQSVNRQFRKIQLPKVSNVILPITYLK